MEVATIEEAIEALKATRDWCVAESIRKSEILEEISISNPVGATDRYAEAVLLIRLVEVLSGMRSGLDVFVNDLSSMKRVTENEKSE